MTSSCVFTMCFVTMVYSVFLCLLYNLYISSVIIYNNILIRNYEVLIKLLTDGPTSKWRGWC